MKITLESTEHDINLSLSTKRLVSIEVDDDNLTMDRVIDELVKPVLIAYGFHPKTVEEAIPDEN